MLLRKIFANLILFALIFAFNFSAKVFAAENVTVYWYVCGTDLESNNKFLTHNFEELKKISLPENVKFIIQTGGTKKFHTKEFPNKISARFVYDSQGLKEIERLGELDMGSEETLKNFLQFGKENFPADKNIFIFWNHGGGTLYGICLDEFSQKTVSLNGIKNAFSETYGENISVAPFELICFDSCLMATIETASALQKFSNYMVASEEVTPGEGFDYQTFPKYFSEASEVKGDELGKKICDDFLTQCKKFDTADTVTMSVIDLKKIPELNSAYEKLGYSFLNESKENPQRFFTRLDRVANLSEKYSSDDTAQVSMNLVDLGDWAQDLKTDAADEFVQAVKNSVVYRVSGSFKKYGLGISGYFPFDGKSEPLEIYQSVENAPEVFKNLYSAMLTGNQDGKAWFDFDLKKLAGVQVLVDENDIPFVKISPEDTEAISDVRFQIYKPENNDLLFLGSDDKLAVDWDEGIFKEDFDGKTPRLNGNLLENILIDQQRDYNTYVAPILLNGTKYLLWSVYDLQTEKFNILGARKVLKNGLSDRAFVQLKVGDKITPLFEFDKSDKIFQGKTFTLNQAPVLEDEFLDDGEYAFVFQFFSPRNEPVISQTVFFKVENGSLELIEEKN